MRQVALILAAAGILAACHRQPEVIAAPQPAYLPPAVDSTAILARQRDSIARAEEMARQDRIKAEQLQADLAARDTIYRRVHFAFDQAVITPEDRALLLRKVAILERNPGLVLQIAGHADERGSDEYNLALGQRRAAAVRAFLVNQGVPSARLETVSFGEERPLYDQSEEWAWAFNRRDEFALVSGPPLLQAP